MKRRHQRLKQAVAEILNENFFLSAGPTITPMQGMVSAIRPGTNDLTYGKGMPGPSIIGLSAHPSHLHTVDEDEWNDDQDFKYDDDDDMELFHEDDETSMIKSDVGIMMSDLKDLYEMLCTLHKTGREVDYPHWWQSKLVLAKDYITKATDYLKEELSERKY